MSNFIFNAERPSFPPPFNAFLADLAQVGVGPNQLGQEYAVFAARSNPRWWLTPMGYGGHCARAGLAMFQPISRAAMVAKAGLNLLARYTPPALWAKQYIKLAGQPDFANVFGRNDLCYAYFTGTEGPHRKTAVQIMSQEGAILGYAKISRTPHIIRYMANEAHILNYLLTLKLCRAEIPALLAYRDKKNMAVLVTDSMKSKGFRVPKTLESAHRTFLIEIAEKTGRIGAGATLTALADRIDSLKSVVSDSWIARLSAGHALLLPHADKLPVGLAHGDFTPWNSFMLGSRLYVFDWEYAEMAWPLGYDTAHFMLSVGQHKNPQDTLTQVLSELIGTHAKSNTVQARRLLLLSLLLHAAFYLQRATEAEKNMRPIAGISWPEGETRAVLIDELMGHEMGEIE